MNYAVHARAAAAGLALVLALGCTADELEQTGVPPVLGYTQFQIYEGSSTEADELRAWSVSFTDVYRSRALGTGSQIISFDLNKMTATGTEAAPERLCWFQANKLITDYGEVLFTASGMKVYAGDHSVPDEAALLYRFEGPGVFYGEDQQRTASATINLHLAEPATKLLITALIEGVCGGDGL